MRAWLLVLVAVSGAAQAADEVAFVNEGIVPVDESLAMRRFFEAGNQQTIETIRRHFGAPAP